MTSPARRRPARAALATSLVALTALTAVACSDEEPVSAPPAGASTSAAPEPLATNAEVAVVAGRLDRAARQRVLRAVVGVVDQWIDRAYLGDYPRDDFAGAFASFTDDAARRAAQEERLMSNAAVGEQVQSVTATRRALRLDVLAPDGRPAGATARLRLRLRLEGHLTRTDVVTGRLTLTPAGEGWRVFGWSLERVEA